MSRKPGLRLRTVSFALVIAAVADGHRPLTAQSARSVAPGVFVVTTPSGRTAGWVDLGSDVLAIVPGDGNAALGVIRRAAAKPIRAAFKPGGGSSLGAEVIELVPVARGSAGGGVGFRGTLRIGAHAEVRELERAVAAGNGVVYLPESGVLFAGNLVGEGAVLDSSRSESWIRVLELLERLNPRVVIPEVGTAGGVELLRETRSRLLDVRAEVRRGVDSLLPIDRIAAASRHPALARHLAREMVGLVPPSMIEELELRPGSSPTRSTPGWTKPRSVVIDDFWPGQTARLAELAYVAPGVEVRVAKDPAETASLIVDADALLGRPTVAAFRAATRLRWIQSPSAGVEGPLAIPGLVESPVVLTNAQRIYAPPLVEHVFGLLLGLTRKLQVAVPLMRERSWQDDPVVFPPAQMPELRGKTLLVAGLGGIGTEVAALGHAMGMRVIATRNNKTPPTEIVEYVGSSAELATLLPQADVVVNCLPLTPATRKTFDAAMFRLMRRTAYFINIGRGGTVDTEALAEALASRAIGGAGLDVTDPEPLPATHRLWTLPNFILTPHMGSSSDLERERTWLLFRENLRRFVAGEALLSVVDKKAAY